MSYTPTNFKVSATVDCPHCVNGVRRESYMLRGERATREVDCADCKGSGEVEVTVDLDYALAQLGVNDRIMQLTLDVELLRRQVDALRHA